MKLLDQAFDSPEANLACDEALLEVLDSGAVTETDQIVRFWEPKEYFVVTGYANCIETEVDRDFCLHRRIPIFRRCSGGGTVLQGPGVLNYSFLSRFDGPEFGGLATVTGTNRAVMEGVRAAMESATGRKFQVEGHTDLAAQGRKVSGNAQRRKRRALLFHGSILLNMDLELMQGALRRPSKEPDYRRSRSHVDFVENLGIAPDEAKAALVRQWKAESRLESVPWKEIAELARNKYSTREWNYRF